MQRDFVILVVKVACVHPVSYNCASHLIYVSKLFKVFKLFKDDGPLQWLLGRVQSLPGVVAHALLPASRDPPPETAGAPAVSGPLPL